MKIALVYCIKSIKSNEEKSMIQVCIKYDLMKSELHRLFRGSYFSRGFNDFDGLVFILTSYIKKFFELKWPTSLKV